MRPSWFKLRFALATHGVITPFTWVSVEKVAAATAAKGCGLHAWLVLSAPAPQYRYKRQRTRFQMSLLLTFQRFVCYTPIHSRLYVAYHRSYNHVPYIIYIIYQYISHVASYDSTSCFSCHCIGLCVSMYSYVHMQFIWQFSCYGCKTLHHPVNSVLRTMNTAQNLWCFVWNH